MMLVVYCISSQAAVSLLSVTLIINIDRRRTRHPGVVDHVIKDAPERSIKQQRNGDGVAGREEKSDHETKQK